jgi:hypothetical protein
MVELSHKQRKGRECYGSNSRSFRSEKKKEGKGFQAPFSSVLSLFPGSFARLATCGDARHTHHQEEDDLITTNT